MLIPLSLKQKHSLLNVPHMRCQLGLLELAWEPKTTVAATPLLGLRPPVLVGGFDVLPVADLNLLLRLAPDALGVQSLPALLFF